MKASSWPWLVALLALGLPARAVDLRQRSESSSHQFVIYSADIRLRQRVASYAEDVKQDFLRLLGETDRWKAPIVVTLARAATEDLLAPPATLHFVATPAGKKIELNVRIGDDPATVDLQKQFVRAVLLEYAYRSEPLTGGAEFTESPWWVVEGLIELGRRRDVGVDSSLFRRLIDTNHLPPLEQFFQENPEQLSPTALAVDRALAMALLQMLVDQPGGRENLRHYLRTWPKSNGDGLALLRQEFPEIAGDHQTLQKWWTVNLARFAAADRFEGLTVAETDAELAKCLSFEVVVDKGGQKKVFGVADYPQFLKLAVSHPLLADHHAQILTLAVRSNPLLRPVVSEYEEILVRLVHRKTLGLRDRLKKAEEYRGVVLKRTSQIADYLNWWEATQMKARSGAFDSYLRIANEIQEEDRRQKGPVGRYLDELEVEF